MAFRIAASVTGMSQDRFDKGVTDLRAAVISVVQAKAPPCDQSGSASDRPYARSYKLPHCCPLAFEDETLQPQRSVQRQPLGFSLKLTRKCCVDLLCRELPGKGHNLDPFSKRVTDHPLLRSRTISAVTACASRRARKNVSFSNTCATSA